MIQSYKKPLQLEEQYDAIIIGTGMGSLTNAAFLAKEGKKVLLLEKCLIISPTKISIGQTWGRFMIKLL
jgi:choline dehydrogenase-like flavoprotein